MDWNSPTTKKHIAEAEARDCELVGAGKNKDYRIYGLPCGHKQEVQVSSMRKGAVRCQACLANKFKEEAKAQDCILLGPGKSSYYRFYRLPSGE